MTDYKIVFEHWRVWNRFNEDFPSPKNGKPTELCRYYRNDKKYIWHPYHRGGKTVCRILKDGVEIAYGETLCSMSDNFCYKTGRELALSRAWKKLDEPDTMCVANLWCYDDQDKGIPYAIRLMNSGLS